MRQEEFAEAGVEKHLWATRREQSLEEMERTIP